MESVVMTRKVRLEDADRSFDIAFWQAQSSTARFTAAWDLVVHALQRQGSRDEPRLQRTVATLQCQPDLITTKRAAGRPQDLLDVSGLERARDEQTQQ